MTAGGDRVQVTYDRVQGFQAVTIENAALACTVIPDLGGKISSIRDRRTGREWLWSNPSLPYRRAFYGASFVEQGDSGGWDECFPTVAACRYPCEPWKDFGVPDHGDLWSMPWPVDVVQDERGGISLSSEVTSPGILPYRWRRVISLTPAVAMLHVAYEVTSMAAAPIAYIWSAHPLLALQAGMHIRIPAGAPMHRWTALPPGLLAEGDSTQAYAWPVHARAQGRNFDLSFVPQASAGFAVKLWSDPLGQGEVSLGASDGEFRLTFDPVLIPQVGLWLNAGGWAGTGDDAYYNLGLEPCIGAPDSLEEAVTMAKPHRILPACASHAWWLDVTLFGQTREQCR